MTIDPVLGVRLVYIFGALNLIGIALVILSCRCFLGNRVTEKLRNYTWYQKFYRKHAWYWCLFIGSVLIHTIMAFMVFGNPV